MSFAVWYNAFCGKVLIASEGNDEMEIAMATGYMDASDAAYDTLAFLVDVYGVEYVLGEFCCYMNVDTQVKFVYDFIKCHDVDTSEMNDDTIRTIEDHYNRHC